MPLKKKKKRRLQETAGEDEPQAETEKTTNPAFKKKGWKSVQLDLEVMKEFEAEGGLFFEEADPDEVGVQYLGGAGDLSADPAPPKKTKKRKRSKVQANEASSQPAPDLASENEKLRQQLEQLKEKSKIQEEEIAVAELSAWAEFELHPKILHGLHRLGFKAPTPVQARCLPPAVRQRKDIVGAAQTGSGKTLAFGLPILHHTLCSLDQSTVTEGGSSSSSKKGAEVRKQEVPSSTADGPRALVLLPTRELAVQVQAHINAVADGTPIHAECLVGGISMEKQKRLLRRKPGIVVGTPGRIFALLGMDNEADRSDWLRDGLKCLRHLVLDEADRLVESGHFKELDKILELVYSSLARPQQLQTFVFSATLTLDPRSIQQKWRGEDSTEGKVDMLMGRLNFRDTRSIFTADLTKSMQKDAEEDENSGKVEAATSSNLPQQLQFKELVCSDDKDKECTLAMWLLRRFRWGIPAKPKGGGLANAVAAVTADGTAPAGGRVILFVNAVSYVMRLSSVLSLLLESPSASKVLSKVKMAGKGDKAPPGLAVDVLDLHSKMRQKDRLNRIERFRKLKHAVLVCTDIAARGLDVPEVSAVLHFEAPRGSEVFVHRSGRTARAGREGESISCMAPGDAQHWSKLYRAVGISKDRVQTLDVSPEEISASKEACRLAADLEKKVHRSSKQATEKNWFQRAAKEADLMLDSDDEDKDKGKAAAPHHQLWGLYRQLQARVRQPPRRSGAAPLSRKARLSVARRGR